MVAAAAPWLLASDRSGSASAQPTLSNYGGLRSRSRVRKSLSHLSVVLLDNCTLGLIDGLLRNR
jgi:hypothetical protein